MYTIEVMKPEDFAAVYDLWLSVKGMGLNNLDDTEEGFAVFLRRNPSTCFKASEDGVMCGVIMAGHDGRRGYIYHTAVREECRGRGIGRALVEAVKEALIPSSLSVNEKTLVLSSIKPHPFSLFAVSLTIILYFCSNYNRQI